MKKVNFFILISLSSAVLFFFFCRGKSPDNIQFNGVLNSTLKNDIVIVFNSGGWGNTPIEKAEDLAPIIRGIDSFLEGKGYDSIVVPYERTKNGFFAKAQGSKEFFNYFRNQSEDAAGDIINFLEKNPDKKVILIGLSVGASFVDETMKKIQDTKNSVLAIEVGTPFWQKKFDSKDILYLDNSKKDPLSDGRVKILLPTAFKAPVKFLLAKMSGAKTAFTNFFWFSGHMYPWGSKEVGFKITSFLETKLAP